MKTVRQRIFDYINAHRTATASEISRSFRMSHSNARHHLTNLIELGAIQVINFRKAAGKGRPERVFAVSEESSASNLDQLASILLELTYADRSESSQIDPSLQISEALTLKMSGSVEPVSDPNKPSRNLTRQLNQLIEILNKYHYGSRWEAHADGPRIILGRCPYAQILTEHPELCRIDENLISNLLGTKVSLIIKQAFDSFGLRYCELRIQR